MHLISAAPGIVFNSVLVLFSAVGAAPSLSFAGSRSSDKHSISKAETEKKKKKTTTAIKGEAMGFCIRRTRKIKEMATGSGWRSR